MQNPLPEPINLMDDETKARFLNSGFTEGEIQVFATAHTIDGKPQLGIDFQSDAFTRMLQDRFEIMESFYGLGYSWADYTAYIDSLYSSRAARSPFDLLSAESAPKRSDLSVGEYNRRLKRRDQVRSRLPSYFGSQEIQEHD